MHIQSLSAKLDAAMHLLYSPTRPGAALLVIKEGYGVIEKGYGMANLHPKEKITPATNFRMASLSKQFTAMSVLILVEKGVLSLHDPISLYLPGLPPCSQRITIGQLLVHASGIWDYEDMIPAEGKTQVHDEDVWRLMQQKERTYFSPGAAFRYSNTGYCLLSLIVQKASGLPYATFVNGAIFQKLGMHHSQVYIKEKSRDIVRRAYGYHPLKGEDHLADQSITSATQGDGGVYTSIQEYRLWSEALDNRLLLSQALSDNIFTAHIDVTDGIGYGYGWFTGRETDGSRGQFHSGESTGFHHMAYRNPDHRVLILLLTNRDDNTIIKAFHEVTSLLEISIDMGRPVLTPTASLFEWLSHVYQAEHR